MVSEVFDNREPLISVRIYQNNAFIGYLSVGDATQWKRKTAIKHAREHVERFKDRHFQFETDWEVLVEG